MPFHANRRWVVWPVASPAELANKLHETMSFCGCQGFRVGDFIYLNDSTGPDGAQEYAVVHAPAKGIWHQVDELLENKPPAWDAEPEQGFMDAVMRARPSAAKGGYVRGIAVSSTMGPGVKIEPTAFKKSA